MNFYLESASNQKVVGFPKNFAYREKRKTEGTSTTVSYFGHRRSQRQPKIIDSQPTGVKVSIIPKICNSKLFSGPEHVWSLFCAPCYQRKVLLN